MRPTATGLPGTWDGTLSGAEPFLDAEQIAKIASFISASKARRASHAK